MTHRIVPNWAAAALLAKNKDVSQTMHDPKNGDHWRCYWRVSSRFLEYDSCSDSRGVTSNRCFRVGTGSDDSDQYRDASDLLVGGFRCRETNRFLGTLSGGIAQLIMGNAVPGVVLGILIGKGVDESGWNRVTKSMMIAIVLLFVFSGFFRGFDMEMIKSFQLQVPHWLDNLHNIFSVK